MTPRLQKSTSRSEVQLLRHDINNAIYTFNAAFGNLLGKKPNPEEAKALFAAGIDRLHAILARASESQVQSKLESKSDSPTAGSSQQLP